jgi:hypothetical protein
MQSQRSQFLCRMQCTWRQPHAMEMCLARRLMSLPLTLWLQLVACDNVVVRGQRMHAASACYDPWPHGVPLQCTQATSETHGVTAGVSLAAAAGLTCAASMYCDGAVNSPHNAAIGPAIT